MSRLPKAYRLLLAGLFVLVAAFSMELYFLNYGAVLFKS